jgi:hypothetical protein
MILSIADHRVDMLPKSRRFTSPVAQLAGREIPQAMDATEAPNFRDRGLGGSPIVWPEGCSWAAAATGYSREIPRLTPMQGFLDLIRQRTGWGLINQG